MSTTEMSYQQLDPVGSYGSRPITFVLSLTIVAVAVVTTAISWGTVSYPIVAILAVVCTGCSVGGVLYWSSALRAPFRLNGFVAVLVLAFAGLVLSSVASWASHSSILDRWAPVPVGMILVQLSSYRPARELTAATILGGLLVGFLAVIVPGEVHNGIPPLVRVLNDSMPVIALGAGATAYSAVMVRSLGQWYARSQAVERAASPAMQDRVVRLVHDDRVGILNNTVVPFFTELLVRDPVTAADRERAKSIADSIRRAMVADVDRSWLDATLDHLAVERADLSVPGSEAVQDPQRLATEMTTEQRVVIRAVLGALFDHPGSDTDGFGILLAAEGERASVTITAKLDSDDSLTRSGLAPYLAVLRIAFTDLQVSFQPPTLTLRFSYDHK